MFSLAPAQRGWDKGSKVEGGNMEAGEPREWVAGGPHRLAGTRDRGTNRGLRCRESRSPRRTASGPRPGTCARPAHPLPRLHHQDARAAPPQTPVPRPRGLPARPKVPSVGKSGPALRRLLLHQEEAVPEASALAGPSFQNVPPQRLLWSSPSLLSF